MSFHWITKKIKKRKQEHFVDSDNIITLNVFFAFRMIFTCPTLTTTWMFVLVSCLAYVCIILCALTD